MTGHKPVSTTVLAVWSGVKIKQARKFVAKRTLVESYCAKLEVALGRLHEKVRDQREARQRQKALRAAKRHPGQAFHRGDYVMVAAANNQANPVRSHKVKVFWQGPYEVLGGDGPTSYRVRMLGDTQEAEVHWMKLRRLAGPEFEPDEEVVASALHDRQRFLVEKFDDWIVDSDGDAVLLVRWKHHSEEERTWEPLQQLWDDVPIMVEKYVVNVEVPTLTQALEEAKAAS